MIKFVKKIVRKQKKTNFGENWEKIFGHKVLKQNFGEK